MLEWPYGPKAGLLFNIYYSAGSYYYCEINKTTWTIEPLSIVNLFSGPAPSFKTTIVPKIIDGNLWIVVQTNSYTMVWMGGIITDAEYNINIIAKE